MTRSKRSLTTGMSVIERLDDARARLVGQLDAPARQVEAERTTVVLEQAEVGAGPAAAVEDGGIDAVGDGVGHQRPDERAEPAPPEMHLFGAMRGFEKAIHNSSALRILVDCRVET